MVVCGKQSSHHSHPSIDRLSGHEALKLVCEASDRGPAHRRCRQEQRLTCLLRCSNCWEQRARENDRGGRKTNMRNLHKRRKDGGQGTAKRVLQRSGRARASVWAGKQEAAYHNQSPFPTRNRGESPGKADNARVLLRFP